MRGFAAALLLAVALLVPPLAARADAPVPKLTRHVTDLTGTLTGDQIARLDARLVDLEKTKGAQVVVLMVPTTQPDDLESYSLKVAETNKVGREGPDDGLLLLLAKNDRRVRIEVGYGLEGALPDAIASRIIREYMAPKLRANDYYGGIDEALNAITQIVQGEALPPPVAPDESHERRGGGHLLVPLLFAAIFLRGILGRAPLGVRMPLGGVIAGGFGWLFLHSILGGLLGLVAGALFMAIPLGAGRSIGGGGWGGFGGWGGGGGFGGGGFGGGGGGGFSGGGGSFGGGGASGNW
ncbi:TPM domain-containing protein [Luteibacter sp. SG786]|uniref:TPM domain-containing protein n=1 Tax=Luteibacter sp. SG786 TaxID=2587130 RepID=UPI00141F2B2D|nr:TPM domain-containing protein [Luteibacter sp. SG786]NII54294.1 uncharacterized protein [Luteibacter sp. SG786]